MDVKSCSCTMRDINSFTSSYSNIPTRHSGHSVTMNDILFRPLTARGPHYSGHSQRAPLIGSVINLIWLFVASDVRVAEQMDGD